MFSVNKIKDFTKQSFLPVSRLSSEARTLLKNLDETKKELSLLSDNLNYVTDPILLNYLIFQIKAAEVRYQYWFCMARDMNLKYPEEDFQTNV